MGLVKIDEFLQENPNVLEELEEKRKEDSHDEKGYISSDEVDFVKKETINSIMDRVCLMWEIKAGVSSIAYTVVSLMIYDLLYPIVVWDRNEQEHFQEFTEGAMADRYGIVPVLHEQDILSAFMKLREKGIIKCAFTVTDFDFSPTYDTIEKKQLEDSEKADYG